MTLIDTHTHLYEDAFDADRTEMIERAITAGVTKMIIPNVDSKSIDSMLNLVKQFPENIFPMIGLHPCYVKPENYKRELEIIQKELYPNAKGNNAVNNPDPKGRNLAESNSPLGAGGRSSSPLNISRYVALGEIGIDLYWDKTTFDIQKEAFELQCDWAIEKDLPVAIHSRESTSQLIDIFKNRSKNPRGVFHCFTGTAEEAKEILDLGFFLGIGGVVTYKNTHLRDVLKNISIQHIVLETDSPYLPPVPYRGKRNESAYTKIVAETLCTVYQKSPDEIAAITTQNAHDLFGI